MANELSEYFQQLGETLQTRWATENFDEKTFPELAQSLLLEQDLPSKVSPDALIDWVLDAKTLPMQTNLHANFGDLNLTLYQNDKFYIEALFWLDGTTAIHQHAFSGAFQVLAGNSIHSSYTFHPQRRINGALLKGEVRCEDIELLPTKAVRRIHSTPYVAHSLFHLNYPNISLVVRTYSDPYAKPQLSYLKPCFAFDSFKQDPVLLQKINTLQVISQLDREQYKQRFLQAAEPLDLYSHCMLIIHHAKMLYQSDFLEPAIDQLKEKDLELGDAMLATATQMYRGDMIIKWRAKVKDPQLKFFLAVLLNAPGRTDALALVEQMYPQQTPTEALIDWLGQLLEVEGLSGLDIDAEALPFVKCLVEGKPFEQLLEDMKEEFDADELEHATPALRQCYEQLKHRSMLNTLFVD